MKAWGQFLFPLLVLFLLSAPSSSQERISTLSSPLGCGTPPVNEGLSPLLRSPIKEITGMWLGTWESFMHPGMTGAVKAIIHQVNQKVGGTVELERTALGDVMIQMSGTLMGRILIARGDRAGYSYMIQGRVRERVLSGTYHVWVPFEKHHDWGWFQVEVLETPEDLKRA